MAMKATERAEDERTETPKGRATRERIFAAAIALISALGYEETTIPGICREAEVSVGSFYHHFRSKSDLLLAYVRDESDRLLDYYQGLGSLSREEALLACVRRFFGYYAVKGRSFVASFLAILMTEGGEWFSPEELSIQSIARDCLARGAALGGSGPSPGTETAVELASALVWDLSCSWCIRGGPPGLEEEAERRFRGLLGLLRGEKARSPEISGSPRSSCASGGA